MTLAVLLVGCVAVDHPKPQSVVEFSKLFCPDGLASEPEFSLERTISLAVTPDLAVFTLSFEPVGRDGMLERRCVRRVFWDGTGSAVLHQWDLDILGIESASHLYLDGDHVVITDMAQSRIHVFNHDLQWQCAGSLYDGFYARSISRVDSNYWLAVGLRPPANELSNLHLYAGKSIPCALDYRFSYMRQPDVWRSRAIRPFTRLLVDCWQGRGATVWDMDDSIFVFTLERGRLEFHPVGVPKAVCKRAEDCAERFTYCFWLNRSNDALACWTTDTGNVVMIVSPDLPCQRVTGMAGKTVVARLGDDRIVVRESETNRLRLYRRMPEGQDVG